MNDHGQTLLLEKSGLAMNERAGRTGGATASKRLLWTARCRVLVAAAIALAWCGNAPIAADAIPDITRPVPSTTPATLTSAELREGICRTLKKIHAIDAEYTDLCRLTPTHGSFASTIPFVFNHEAHKGDRRFAFRRTLEYPHRGDLAADIAARPGPGETYRVYDGHIQRYFHEFVRQGGILASKDGSADAHTYPLALGIPIIDDVRALPQEVRVWAGWPPDVYMAPEVNWAVEASCELVDGVPCHVIVEPALGFRKWIDPAAGFATRFSETSRRDEDSGAVTAGIKSRDLQSDLREVAPGIWLPFVMVSVKYSQASDAAAQEMSVEERHDTVAVRLAVNDDVPDSLFKLSFPPGTVVSDTVRDVAYVVGENGEELDQTVEEARRILGVGKPRRLNYWLLVNAAVVITIVAAIFLRMKRRLRGT